MDGPRIPGPRAAAQPARHGAAGRPEPCRRCRDCRRGLPGGRTHLRRSAVHGPLRGQPRNGRRRRPDSAGRPTDRRRSRGPAGSPVSPPWRRMPGTLPRPGSRNRTIPSARPRKPEVASTSYKFLATNDDGTPVGYSPCRPLHYVVNAALAPEGAERLVEDSIRTISEATGITFINDGPTGEAPSPTRAPYQKDAYGDRWAPLLIAWTTPGTGPAAQGPGDRHRRQHPLQFRRRSQELRHRQPGTGRPANRGGPGPARGRGLCHGRDPARTRPCDGPGACR